MTGQICWAIVASRIVLWIRSSGTSCSSSSSSMISSETIESASSIPWRARSAASTSVGGDRLAADVLALLAVEVDRLAVDQVDHAFEVRLGADRDLQRDGGQAELALELLDHVGRVRAGAVHLVDERDAGHVVPLHLAVDGDRLRLHARHGAEDQHRAVEDAERPLDLDGEVDVAGRVDDVDLLVAPVDGGRGRGDRDPALLLQLHVVHHRAFALDLLDHVDAAGVEQDPLGQRGLARVDVGRDPDIADVAKVFHGRRSLSRRPKGWNALSGGRKRTRQDERSGNFSARRSSTG